MSTESTIAFYGVRFEVSSNEITALEERTDPRLVEAKRQGLKHYWGNFAAPGTNYFLFVGDKLGVLGFENDREVEIASAELLTRMQDTEAKLQRAGISTAPSLHLQWQPDA